VWSLARFRFWKLCLAPFLFSTVRGTSLTLLPVFDKFFCYCSALLSVTPQTHIFLCDHLQVICQSVSIDAGIEHSNNGW
jgi:hypothetical protein